MPIFTIKGNAAQPKGDGLKVIAHICNDLGRWGGVFASALSQWPQLQEAYTAWYRKRPQADGVEMTAVMGLGETLFVQVEEDIWVASIVGQHGQGMGAGGRPPIRYDAVKRGLAAVQRFANINEASVHIPKMVVKFAGGHWGNVEQLIKNELANRGLDVTVYEN